MDAGIHSRHKVMLPRPPLHLPPAKRDEAHCQHETDGGDHYHPQWRTGRPFGIAPPRFHVMTPDGHIVLMLCISGIMFVFRWYITHSEPESVMITRIRVKISASSVQPPCDRVFICRK